jgi:sigma-E factor negative regulatory protein RseC
VKSACGQKLLNEGRQGKCIEFELDNLKGANVGDEVTIAIPEDSFLQAAFVMYVLPLITMIAAAVLGEKYFLLSDGGVFLVSSLGFALGLLMVRKFADSKRSQADFQPQVIAVSSSRKLPENNL